MKQLSTPNLAVGVLELVIRQDPVQTSSKHRSAEPQKIRAYQVELAGCHQEMATLNQELLDYD